MAAALVALLAVSLAGCETAKVDAPPEQARAVSIQPQQPARDEARPLDGLAPLGESLGGVTEAEVFRGTGVLTRRLATDPLNVTIQDNGEVTLNFANADIREVVDVVLGETLGVSYIIDPKVQGQITARTSRPLSRQAVIPALENILALNGGRPDPRRRYLQGGHPAAGRQCADRPDRRADPPGPTGTSPGAATGST